MQNVEKKVLQYAYYNVRWVASQAVTRKDVYLEGLPVTKLADHAPIRLFISCNRGFYNSNKGL